MFGRFGRLVRTVRFLKPKQIFFRIFYSFPALAPRRGRIPGVGSIELKETLVKNASYSSEFKSFDFLGETHALQDVGWLDGTVSLLWRYNQHYFDDLNSCGADSRFDGHVELINLWIDEDFTVRSTALAPYPTSIRLVNWVKWLSRNNFQDQKINHSMVFQVRFLMKRIEYHILGNHILTNAKALIFVGSYFTGSEADGWLFKGCSILARELPRQILSDGGHYELSPMYHAIIVEDSLDLINLLESNKHRFRDLSPVDATLSLLRLKMPKQLQWLVSMTHPDGGEAFFNDTTFGIAQKTEKLLQYANSLGFSEIKTNQDGPDNSTHLDASGYFRVSKGAWTLFMDAAEVGPTFLPAHGHADCLSLECSFGEQRILVNSGISTYGESPERLRQRSSSAHNTVVLNSRNSSEVWGGFRVGRRAHPFVTKAQLDNNSDASVIEAFHDGYRFLSRSTVHIRQVECTQAYLMVRDEVTGSPSDAVAHYHFHPAVTIEELTPSVFSLTLLNDVRLELEVLIGKPLKKKSTWHPQFGVSVENHKLVIEADDNKIVIKLSVNHREEMDTANRVIC